MARYKLLTDAKGNGKAKDMKLKLISLSYYKIICDTLSNNYNILFTSQDRYNVTAANQSQQKVHTYNRIIMVNNTTSFELIKIP